jgi:CubicO group peptidase (beta-lactamase class C family)
MIDDWEAMHDLNGADYQAAWNRLRPAGFRPISACVYGPRQAPLYAAIFAKRPARDFVGIHGADTADLQAFFNTNAARGYSPTILSATGPSNNPVFLCVMELSPSGIALTRFGLVKGVIGDQNPNTLEYWLNEADRNNWIPRYVGAYGSPSDVRYTFVADANEERLLWAVAGPEGMSEYQSRFNAETQQYARPVLVTVGPTGYMSIFREDDIGPWAAYHGLDSAGYQSVFNQQLGQGMVPIMVQAGTLDGTNQFAAIFARANRPETRTMRVEGPAVPIFTGVDNAIINYMRTTGTRAASVSVTRQDRLVYSRSFTWAEPSYPLTTSESMFRIASMSKPITAITIFRLVEQGLINLDAALIPTLGLVPPPGRSLISQASAITVRQLLAHSSGLGDVPLPYDVVQAYGTTLPSNERQVAGFALSYLQTSPHLNTLLFPQGTNKVYSNAGYLVLGLIIEQITGESYENAVRRLVMTPLGITRAHLTATTRADQRPNAVRHHAGGMGQSDLELFPSSIEEWAIPVWTGTWPYPKKVELLRLGRPIAAGPYGAGDYGFFDAFGAWCLTSADFARILAAFERIPNPLLKAASVTEMTTPVVISGISELKDYALGWVASKRQHDTLTWHNGILGGMRPFGGRSSKGWSYTTLQNSDAGGLESAVEIALSAVTLDSWPNTDFWASAQLPAW